MNRQADDAHPGGPAPMETYDPIVKTFHWVLALLLIGMLASGFALDWLSKGPIKAEIRLLHKSFGLTVLGLMIFRIAWRVWHPKPPWADWIPQWQQYCAQWGHLLLYLLGLLMPLSGWVMSVAAGHDPTWFGGMVVSLPIDASKPLAQTAHSVHFWVGWLLLAIIVLHVGAVGLHGLSARGVIWRMLPQRRLKRTVKGL